MRLHFALSVPELAVSCSIFVGCPDPTSIWPILVNLGPKPLLKSKWPSHLCFFRGVSQYGVLHFGQILIICWRGIQEWPHRLQVNKGKLITAILPISITDA